MGEVVDLIDYKPHTRGTCICINCKHTFESVAPVGVIWLECPECKMHKATWQYPFMPPEDTLILVCDCVNDLYHITKQGIFCVKCGKLTAFEDIVD